MPEFTAWKADLYKFAGKSFDYAYKNQMNKMLTVMGEVNSKNATYEMTGTGGYGLVPIYDGRNLNEGSLHRGFKTIITPKQRSLSIPLDRYDAKVDKMGLTKQIGVKLGQSLGMTVYRESMNLFSHAWDGACLGGDGKSWAASDHPVASLGSTGRVFNPDPESGTYDNTTTDVLSVSAITKAQARAERFVTPDGLDFDCELDTVLVAPELREKAAKLWGVNAELMPEKDPESDSNAANPVYGMRYIVVKGFTEKQWAVCDRKLMKELVNIVYVERPSVMESELDNPLRALFTAYTVFDAGWADARMIIFGNPA